MFLVRFLGVIVCIPFRTSLFMWGVLCDGGKTGDVNAGEGDVGSEEVGVDGVVARERDVSRGEAHFHAGSFLDADPRERHEAHPCTASIRSGNPHLDLVDKARLLGANHNLRIVVPQGCQAGGTFFQHLCNGVAVDVTLNNAVESRHQRQSLSH